MSDFREHAVIGDAASRHLLASAQIDRLGEALLALTGEVWILTDRMAVLEAVLTQHGIDVSSAIERFVPSPDMEKALDAKRDKLIAAIIAALQPATPNIR
jgi:hypothetical protein